MAEQAEEDLMAEETPGFKAPAEKPLKDLVSTDQEDESLRKYKETLLGTAAANPEDVIFCESILPRTFIDILTCTVM